MALSDGVRPRRPVRRPVRRAPVIAPLVIAFRHASPRARVAVLAFVALLATSGVAVVRATSGPSGEPAAAGGGAFCAALRAATADASLAALAAEDAALRRRGYERFNAALTTLAAAAPAERRGDVATVRAAYASVTRELGAVGFRADAVGSTAFAPLSTARFRAASARLHAHATGTCGLPGSSG